MSISGLRNLPHSGLGVRKEHGPKSPREAWGSVSAWVPSYTSGSALDIICVTPERRENAGLREGNPEAGWAPAVPMGSNLCSPPEPALLGNAGADSTACFAAHKFWEHISHSELRLCLCSQDGELTNYQLG